VFGYLPGELADADSKKTLTKGSPVVALLADFPCEPTSTLRPDTRPGPGRATPVPGRGRAVVPLASGAVPSWRPSAATFRRRRAGAAGLVVVAAFATLAVLQTALGGFGRGPLAAAEVTGAIRPASASIYVVRPGDTLWSIAEAAEPGRDVRPLVDELAAETGDAALYPGEEISVPVG
jgi:hypothetical protein